MNKNHLIKKGISVVACALLLSSTTVSATERLVESQGEFITENPDGTPVILDTDDIESNARKIAQLTDQVGGLSFRYGTEKDMGVGDDDSKGYYWAKTADGSWEKIGAIGEAIPANVLVDRTFSSENGVDISGTMIIAQEAYAEYYADGQNDKTGATPSGSVTVDINNTADTVNAEAIHTEDITDVTVGINESLTKPYGFYDKDMIVRNGVLNNGLIQDVLNSNGGNTTPAAYYEESDFGEVEGYQHLISRLKTFFGDGWLLGDSPTIGDIEGLFADNVNAATKATAVIGDKTVNPTSNLWLTGSNALTAQEELDLLATGTSHYNLGVNEQLTFPAGYYLYDTVVKNGVTKKSAGQGIILNRANPSITFEAGYYDAFTVSPSIPDGNNATFYHHVHDTEVNDKTIITNSSTRTTDGLSDNYESPVPTGCFTQVVYKQHLHKDGSGNVIASTTNRTQGGCFQSMRYTAHTHSGTSSSRSGCFTIPVYNVHYHSGSSSSGGGCYGSSHYTTHTHSGSSSSGGGCYTKAVETTHTHSDSCYSTASYTYSYSSSFGRDGERPELYECKCTCTVTCSVCGATFSASDTSRDESKTITSGQKSRALSAATKKFNNHLTNGKCKSKTTCGKNAGTYVDHYETTCNNSPLNSGLVYDRTCGKTSGVRYASEGIAYYDPSCGNSPLNSSPTYDATCGKTHGSRYSSEGIDYYSRSCGRSRGEVVRTTVIY